MNKIEINSNVLDTNIIEMANKCIDDMNIRIKQMVSENKSISNSFPDMYLNNDNSYTIFDIVKDTLEKSGWILRPVGGPNPRELVYKIYSEKEFIKTQKYSAFGGIHRDIYD